MKMRIDVSTLSPEGRAALITRLQSPAVGASRSPIGSVYDQLIIYPDTVLDLDTWELHGSVRVLFECARDVIADEMAAVLAEQEAGTLKPAPVIWELALCSFGLCPTRHIECQTQEAAKRKANEWIGNCSRYMHCYAVVECWFDGAPRRLISRETLTSEGGPWMRDYQVYSGAGWIGEADSVEAGLALCAGDRFTPLIYEARNVINFIREVDGKLSAERIPVALPLHLRSD